MTGIPAVPEPFFDLSPEKLADPEHVKWLQSWNVEIPAEAKADEPKAEVPDEGYDDDYDTQTKDWLEKEIDRRNATLSEEEQISKTGNKSDLIARLREDDAAFED